MKKTKIVIIGMGINQLSLSEKIMNTGVDVAIVSPKGADKRNINNHFVERLVVPIINHLPEPLVFSPPITRCERRAKNKKK